MNDNVYDVLIIGSGIAGLTSALSIDTRHSVAICSKTVLKSGSTMLAQGGIAAVVDKSDTSDQHIEDTLNAGDYHNDKAAVELVSTESKRAVDWLDGLGVPFDKDLNGNYAASLEAAHSHKRIVHATDFTGQEVEQVLITTAQGRNNIKTFEHYFCTDLLIQDGECVGAIFIHEDRVTTIFAKKIVISSGGLGQVYQWTTNPLVATGDGVAIVSRAGAAIKDLEFIQFHPTALKIGESPLFLLSEALRGESAHIVNAQEKRFLFDSLEKGELAPRDEVSRAIFEEMKTRDVFLDMRHIDGKKIQDRFPNIYKTLLDKYHLNLAHDLIPITPAAHYSCGGVVTDLHGKTSISNLYAVGEVAYTGLHGANRLASNSLLEGVVFGKQTAESINAALFSSQLSPAGHMEGAYSPASVVSDPSTSLGMTKVQQYETQLKKTMWDYVGIVRTKHGLEKAQKIIGDLQKECKEIYDHNTDQKTWELKNMIEVSLLIIAAALNRPTSLGAHYITDKET